MHYHNQEVNGVDDEGDYLDCVGHDDVSGMSSCVLKRLAVCRVNDSVIARLTCHIDLSSIDEGAAHR